jgi:hypothetical protein
MTTSVIEEPADFYGPELTGLIHEQIARLRREIEDSVPSLAGPLSTWMQDLSHGGGPAAYFMHRRSFPMLLVPWWLEGTFSAVDRSFHRDVLYSTVNGYLFIRMVDDVMDREPRARYDILPALGFFHTEFQRAYQRHFPADDEFWRAFADLWFTSADLTARDAALAEVTESDFTKVSSRKISGVKIPLAAICHRYGQPTVLVDWYRLVDRLGMWHQMFNDVRGWSRDLERKRPTYFLFEASRRKSDGEPIQEWVLRTGLEWAAAQLERLMAELAHTAGEIDCPPLIDYLQARQREFAIEWQNVLASVKVVREFASAVDAQRSKG